MQGGRVRGNGRLQIAREIPDARLEFPALQRNFADSLLREFAEETLWRSGFLLQDCRFEA